MAPVETTPPSRRVDGWPAWHLLTGVAASGALLQSAGAIADPDVFWHIKVGDLLRSHHRFPYPDPWSYTFSHRHWHTSQWLSEVLYSLLHQVGGYTSILAFRGALDALFLMWFAWAISRRREPWAGAAIFSAVSLTTLPSYLFQDRPQTISFLFVVWLAVLTTDFLELDVAPRWWAVGLVTAAWANFHGLWVLVPAAILLVGVGRLLERHTSWPDVRGWALPFVASLVGACLTPLGPANLVYPLRLRSATHDLVEWQPTQLVNSIGLGLAILLFVLAIAWARSGRQVPIREIIWVLGLASFAVLAYRNAAPAVILLAPTAAARLETLVRFRSSIRISRPVLVCVLAFALVAPALKFATSQTITSKPRSIAARLADQPSPVRVLDDYNIAGYLIAATNGMVRVAIDGRADLYGAQFIHRYRLAEAGVNWQPLIAKIRPQVAVLPRDSALMQLLVAVDRWRVVERDHNWVLLAPLDQRVT